MQNSNIPIATNDLIIGDAALGRILGISIVTINRLKRENRLPYYKIGHKYRYNIDDVLKSMRNENYDKILNAV